VGTTPALGQVPVTVTNSAWFWGNPSPQGEPLLDIRFSGDVGYAVGDFGTVLRTANGGLTWTGEPSGTSANLDQVQAPAPDTVIVGGGCVLRRSEDGGQNFARLPWTASDTSCPAGIAQIQFPTADDGYLLLTNGNVLRTTDGGQAWSRVATPSSTTPAAAMVFPISTPSVGIAASDGIFRTTNGGTSWTNVDPNAFDVTAVSTTGPGDFLAVSQFSDQAYVSNNDGQTWTGVASSGIFGKVTQVVCGTATDCLLTTDAPGLFQTTDGGARFTDVTPASLSPTSAGWPNATDPVVVTNQGIPAVSNDSGAMFTAVGEQLPAHFADLRVTSPAVASLSGPDGSLALTNDGGRSWVTLETPSSNPIADTSFLNATTGFVLDSAGAVLRTDDAGGSWQTLTDIPGGSSLLALNANDVVLCGRSGIELSRDGGQTFSVTLGGNAINRLDAAGSAVVGSGPSRIEISTNGGAGWRRLALPRGFSSSESVRQVDFTDSRTGYLLGSGGRLFATSTGGRRWTELLALGRASIQSVAFTSTNDGWAAEGGADGTPGVVLRTDDGGLSWRPQRITDDTIAELGASGQEGYALDDAGNLFATDLPGDLGGASSITLHATRPARHAAFTLAGRLTPELGDATVELSFRALSGGRWTNRFLSTGATGAFSFTLRIRHTTAFVAQWSGTPSSRGAGSRAVTVSPR
jgi:photosystem II stability/assembly factor-like uncharacterized protein